MDFLIDSAFSVGVFLLAAVLLWVVEPCGHAANVLIDTRPRRHTLSNHLTIYGLT